MAPAPATPSKCFNPFDKADSLALNVMRREYAPNYEECASSPDAVSVMNCDLAWGFEDGATAHSILIMLLVCCDWDQVSRKECRTEGPLGEYYPLSKKARARDPGRRAGLKP